LNRLQSRHCLYFVLCFVVIVLAKQQFLILVNTSSSLPHNVYLVVKNSRLKPGDYVAFYAKDNGVYSSDLIFTKRIVGVEGDWVKEYGRDYFINGEFIAHAKQHSMQGISLEKGPVGIIREDKYFVYGDSHDSFDSRYKKIGWIDKRTVIGRAYPLF